MDTDRWSIDLGHQLGANGRLHGFYADNRVSAVEPTSNGNSIPGFGHVSRTGGSILTIGESHVGRGLLNEARFGRSTLYGRLVPKNAINPREIGVDVAG